MKLFLIILEEVQVFHFAIWEEVIRKVHLEWLFEKGLLVDLVLRFVGFSVGSLQVVVERDVFGEFLVDLIKPSFISRNNHRVIITILNDIVGFHFLFIKNSFQIQQANFPDRLLNLCTLTMREIVIKLQQFLFQVFKI